MGAFVTKHPIMVLKECSNHDENQYLFSLVFELLLLVSCVRAPAELFYQGPAIGLLPRSCCVFLYFFVAGSVAMWMPTYFVFVPSTV
jgi:hypothetical protein